MPPGITGQSVYQEIFSLARQMDLKSINLYKIPDILHLPDSRVIEICHFGTVLAILKDVYIPNPPPGEGTRRLGRGLTSLPSSIEADGLDSNK